VAFDNGTFKWYVEPYFQNYIESENAGNLPKLKGIGCFVVSGNNKEDLVLIDSYQNILEAYNYDASGFDQMQAKINIIKVSKHFDYHEANNV